MSVSRSLDKLHPTLRTRWLWMQAEWAKRHPDSPQPFITCTWRSHEEQTRLVAEGKSNAQPGQSLHNFEPALAFDVAFDPNSANGIGNDVTWVFDWYQKWGELAEEIGLQWGGRWKHLRDGPHVQMPMTWQDAAAGKLPSLPPLPDQRTPAITQIIIEGNLDIKRDGDTLIVSMGRVHG